MSLNASEAMCFARKASTRYSFVDASAELLAKISTLFILTLESKCLSSITASVVHPVRGSLFLAAQDQRLQRIGLCFSKGQTHRM